MDDNEVSRSALEHWTNYVHSVWLKQGLVLARDKCTRGGALLQIVDRQQLLNPNMYNGILYHILVKLSILSITVLRIHVV